MCASWTPVRSPARRDRAPSGGRSHMRNGPFDPAAAPVAPPLTTASPPRTPDNPPMVGWTPYAGVPPQPEAGHFFCSHGVPASGRAPSRLLTSTLSRADADDSAATRGAFNTGPILGRHYLDTKPWFPYGAIQRPHRRGPSEPRIRRRWRCADAPRRRHRVASTPRGNRADRRFSR